MKTNHKLLLLTTCLFLTAGCAGDKRLGYVGPVLNTNSMINRDQFIREGVSRSEREAKYGPVTAKVDDAKLRASYRKLIDKEESFNYAALAEEATGNSFPISVNVENMEVRTFMNMLSKVSGVNILVSEEVQGTVTARVQDVPWPSVLNSVLSMKKLAKHVDRKTQIIRVHDQDTVVQLEEFERKRMENLQRNMMLEKANEPLYTEVFKLFYANPDKMKEMIAGVMGTPDKSASATASGLRGTQPEITVDSRKHMLIVKARKEDMDTISKLISEVDSRTGQVFIEAFIVEVTDGFERALGARFGLNGQDVFNNTVDNRTANARITGLAGVASSAVTAGDSGATLSNLPIDNPFGGIGFLAGVGTAADLKIELTAMEKAGLTKVISNPRVFTLDNQEAVIFQGDEVPYETTSEDGTKIEFKEAGLKLAVVPSVIGDGNLLLDIKVNKDTVDTTLPNPPITKSEIKTSLVSQDGKIVVIGGIYIQNDADSTDKVPGLGDIPGAGHLFKRNSKQNDRRELMIFIAPRVL